MKDSRDGKGTRKRSVITIYLEYRCLYITKRNSSHHWHVLFLFNECDKNTFVIHQIRLKKINENSESEVHRLYKSNDKKKCKELFVIQTAFDNHELSQVT